MNSTFRNAMQEATRLTQSGRLQDATALIQQALAGSSAPPPAEEARSSGKRAPVTLDGVVEPSNDADAATTAADDIAAASDTFRARRPRSSPRRRRPSPRPVAGKLRDLVAKLSDGDNLAAQLGKLGKLNLQLDDLPLSGKTPTVPVPEGARYLRSSYSDAADSRDYTLYIPSSYQGDPLPLVVMLHGCTQNPDDFAVGTGMNTLAEERGCLVVYPAQASSANPNRCWNWFEAAQQQRDHGEPKLIAAITRQVMADYAVDPTRVYVAGLSAGGAMAAIMATTYPDLYAAVGIHSGLGHGAARDIPSAFAAMGRGGNLTDSERQPIPTLVIHGDRDSTVNPDNGEQIVSQWQQGMAAAGHDCQITTETVTPADGHAFTRLRHWDANDRVLLEQWRIHGAGHAWAGGSPAGSYTDTAGPDASAGLLDFCLAHRRA